jgi:predicted nuclease with TOPRIM domain
MQHELEAEMTRNAAMSRDKNGIADMLDNSVTKMEQMQRKLAALEEEKVHLLMENSKLETENIQVQLLSREKSSLEGAVDEYHVKMADLQRKNQELESETMSLKQELIDVLEVASIYQ